MSKVLQIEIREDQSNTKKVINARGQKYDLFSSEFLRHHGLHLLGTATCWFLLDIAFYSQNLFQKDIFSSINWISKANTMSAVEEVYKIAIVQTFITLCGTVPGYWFTIFLIDKIGRFSIQLISFGMMTLFMLAFVVPYHHWTTSGNHIGFVVLYGLTFFFANFGLNSYTFIVPAEIFPARL
ncbi:Major facilitator sugar transporter-like protein [Dioscorea alata]|uniref:Major facilitator sugar transporter-like protein n=1 Tax=Dioscorea alata TaxID=55571 RepID=A0ACB7VGY7_DIOAL|nr:Major facilitator sugar transporter-like protein [Dioscorea alata]